MSRKTTATTDRPLPQATDHPGRSRATSSGGSNADQNNQKLRRAGLKATLPRLRILAAMQQTSARHLSAEQIYRELIDEGEDTSLATVYRVLNQFEQAGFIVRHNLDGDSALYELAPTRHHDHIMCVECGKLFEFTDATIEQRQREVVAGLGMRLTDHAHYLYAECEREPCEYREALEAD